MLGIALEGAPFISSFNRGQAKKLAAKMQPGALHLDAALAQLVAVREGRECGGGGLHPARRKRLQSLRDDTGSSDRQDPVEGRKRRFE